MTPNIGVASGTSVLLNSSTADGITGRFIAQGSGSPFAVYAEAIGAATQNVGLYSVVSGGTANIGFMINVAAGANHYAILTIGTAKSSLGGALEIAGGFTPASLADGSATNGTIYYSTTASKLAYKDSGGVVNALY